LYSKGFNRFAYFCFLLIFFSKNDTHKTVAKNKNGKNLNIVAIKSIDRLGNESEYFAKKIK